MIIKMKRTTPAYRQPQSTTTIMRDLLIAEVTLAIASILMQVYRHNINYGLKAFGMYIMAILTALITEGVWAWIHQKPMKGIITDSFCLNYCRCIRHYFDRSFNEFYGRSISLLFLYRSI